MAILSKVLVLKMICHCPSCPCHAIVDRIHLTRFRINNHKLLIEYGRYTNTPVNDRLCKHCHEIEDENNFLLECKRHYKTFDKVNSIFNPELPNQIKCL